MSRASTGRSVTRSKTSRSSPASRKPGSLSRRTGRTTTTAGRTARWVCAPPPPSLQATASPPQSCVRSLTATPTRSRHDRDLVGQQDGAIRGHARGYRRYGTRSARACATTAAAAAQPCLSARSGSLPVVTSTIPLARGGPTNGVRSRSQQPRQRATCSAPEPAQAPGRQTYGQWRMTQILQAIVIAAPPFRA